MMAQYPSYSFAAESVPKNTRKGKSMKLLVLAVYAQLRVGAGRIGLWAGCNGIRHSTHLPLEAFFCGCPHAAWGNPSVSRVIYRLKIKPIMRCIF